MCFPSSGNVQHIGLCCPVPDCQDKHVTYNWKQDLKRHWMEQHEELTALQTCVVCNFVTKRKTNLLRHIKFKHPQLNPQEGLGPVQYQENKRYINPHPFTQDMLFGGL